jgi:hypothetical protein
MSKYIHPLLQRQRTALLLLLWLIKVCFLLVTKHDTNTKRGFTGSAKSDPADEPFSAASGWRRKGRTRIFITLWVPLPP